MLIVKIVKFHNATKVEDKIHILDGNGGGLKENLNNGGICLLLTSF